MDQRLQIPTFLCDSAGAYSIFGLHVLCKMDVGERIPQITKMRMLARGENEKNDQKRFNTCRWHRDSFLEAILVF